MAIEDTKIEKVVLVIHGVGDPPPGGTLNHFARSLARDEEPLVEQQSTIWLGERSVLPKHTKTFPAHVRQLDIDETHVEFAEVFWGDLSQVKRGTIGLINGLFQILFGLRYVAYVAADQPGKAARLLKQLGLISSRVLQGPVLAIAIFLAMLTAAAFATDTIWPGSYRDAVWTQALLGGCAVLAGVATAIGVRLTRSRVMLRFWFWLSVVTVWSLFLLVLKTYLIDTWHPEINCEHCARPGLIWYCRVLVVMLGLLWFIESMVVIAMGICWMCAWHHRRVYRPAINLAFLLPALTVGIWGQALPMAWVLARKGVSKSGRITEFVAIFDEALPLLGVQFMMMVIMAMVSCFVLYRYFAWRTKNDIRSFRNGSRPPRLIVSPLVQWTLGVCTMVGVTLTFFICSMNVLGIQYIDSLFGRTLAESNKYAVMLMVPLGGLLIVISPYLRPGFDILLDVVNHFYFRSTLIDDALDDDDEFDIKETTFESGSLFFNRRDRIHSRIKKILVYYRERLKHRPELVIICHSQGTMVGIEILNDPEMSWLSSSFSKTTLVTMGSPLTFLYQHYFGHLYPSLNEPFWDEFRQRIDAWHNLFRVDDFVGQEIDFPISSPAAGFPAIQSFGSETNFSSWPLGCRGHLNYWDDQDALKIIRSQIFQKSADQSNQADQRRAA